MPYEENGYVGKNFAGGLLLDYAMGQYETYTPMQLASYVNTIANDGKRMKLRYVSHAIDPMTDIVVYENKPEVRSTLDDLEALKFVQLGFRSCVTEGLCRGDLNHNRYSVAAKTGTSETFLYKDGITITDAPHSLMVAYAPFDNPEVSIACAAPNSTNGRYFNNICQPIANKIFDYYFNNK